MKRPVVVFALAASLAFLVSCGTDPKLQAVMKGSVVLQLSNGGADGKPFLHFYRLSTDAPGHLAAVDLDGPPFSGVTGPILGVSPDRERLVFDSTTPGNEGLRILAMTSGVVDKLNFDAQRPVAFTFSPDSRRLACTDSHQVVIYDCVTKTSVTVQEARSEEYGGGLRVYAFAGNVAWVGANALYYQYRSDLPFTFEENSSNDPRHPDRCAIVTADGKVIRVGELRGFAFMDAPSSGVL